MSKFKVGDKVRILDGSKIENYTGCWNIFMDVCVGEVYTIKSVNRDWTDGRVSYRLNDVFFDWDERGLELVSEQKIVIITDGRITKARLYKDEKLVGQAVARCAPDDKFDFNVGAGLAFTRLMGTSPVATSLDWDKFAHGKLEVKVNKKNYDAFMKECYQRGFTWYSGREVESPWQLYDEMSSFAKALVDAPSDHIYISFADGNLKWGYKRDKDSDEYKFI
jgi:hypothetical protein